MAIEPIRDAADQAARAPDPAVSFLLSSTGPWPLEETLDPEDFERRLLALALSPEGAGASRAWILRRTESGCIEVARESHATAGTLADAGVKRTIDPLGAGRAVAEAWRDARVVWSRERGAGSPWSDAAEIGAVGYRLDRGPARLLVAAWDREDAGAEHRFTALAHLARQSARALEAREGWRRSGEQSVALVEWMRAAAASHHLNEGLRAGARAAPTASARCRRWDKACSCR